jgi:hypothetical protein
MDVRDMEEEGKDGEGDGWGIGFFFNFLELIGETK